MIADKFVDLYARNSGLRDKLVTERDVVLAVDPMFFGSRISRWLSPRSRNVYCSESMPTYSSG